METKNPMSTIGWVLSKKKKKKNLVRSTESQWPEPSHKGKEKRTTKKKRGGGLEKREQNARTNEQKKEGKAAAILIQGAETAKKDKNRHPGD